ncbi:chromosomal replication initiator DnaA, partial [Bacillus cereus]
IGVYQITKKQIAFETGYSQESVRALMQRFEEYHKLIKYDDQTREMVIFNWGKYNLKRAGKPIEDLIKKELKEVKNVELLVPIYYSIEQPSIKNIFADFLSNHESTKRITNRGTYRGQEEEKEEEEKEEEKEEEEKEEDSSSDESEQPIAIPYKE